MTKALRITSIVVAAVAVLLIALPAVFSSGMDQHKQSLLDSPGVLESLKKNAASLETSSVSPLVQQAEKFAAYLNPPPPPKPPRREPTRDKKPSIRPSIPIAAKFDLLGTSYYALRPELSLALIDEPGKGLRWIRQSSEIGHLIVEEVKDGKVVIRDGTSTYEMEPKLMPKRSLVKGEPSFGAETPSPGIIQPLDATHTSPTEARSSLRPRRPIPRIDPRNTKNAENLSNSHQNSQFEDDYSVETEIFEQFAKETEGIEDPNVWLEKANQLMNRLDRASQEVTDEEAEHLDELGKELQDANDEAVSD